MPVNPHVVANNRMPVNHDMAVNDYFFVDHGMPVMVMRLTECGPAQENRRKKS